MRLHATSYAEGTDVVCGWTGERGGRYVCVANVHIVMEARGDSSFRSIVNEADLVTPDGMPLVWLLRRQGIREASRVYGPTLTEHVCAAAARAEIPVGFYGGTPGANAGIVRVMQRRYPDLNVAYAWAPPFRALTEE